MSDIVTCKNCGKSKNECEYDEYAPPTANGESSHDWSDADPLSRFEARVMGDDMFFRIDSEDNEDWQWIEVGIEDRDKAGASELLASKAQDEGFKFNGLGDDEGVVRFNRKKDE